MQTAQKIQDVITKSIPIIFARRLLAMNVAAITFSAMSLSLRFPPVLSVRDEYVTSASTTAAESMAKNPVAKRSGTYAVVDHANLAPRSIFPVVTHDEDSLKPLTLAQIQAFGPGVFPINGIAYVPSAGPDREKECCKIQCVYNSLAVGSTEPEPTKPPEHATLGSLGFSDVIDDVQTAPG